ncbi:MAG: M2 family metallopeptidase [bacterium]|nr:M2 family metallopeptidase [bacterium]
MRLIAAGLAACMLIALASGCGPSAEEKAASEFVAAKTAELEPLMKTMALAYWKASTTGDEAAYKEYAEADLAIRNVYSDSAGFRLLAGWKKSLKKADPLLFRQVELLHNAFLINQVEPGLLKEIAELAAATEGKFSTFRGTMDGKPVTQNRISEILKESKDSREREKAWLASKQAGALVAADVIRLVKLRNRAAKAIGYDNYYVMALAAGEQDADQVSGLFEELFRQTEKPFANLKAEIDSLVAGQSGVAVEKLEPWHYRDPFFQEAPQAGLEEMDRFYKGRDIKALTASYFASIGMPVDSILDNSDLFERPGKNPHAFCTDIDRLGDVRVLCNIRDNEEWMGTMLHELGHGVYSYYTDRNLPFLLRDAAHAFTTEAVAEYFGALSRDADWMKANLGISDGDADRIRPAGKRMTRAQKLVFARWDMVMTAFERALYENPDQDLNSLWWNLVGKYQGLKKPEGRNAPDWAAKIHFVMAPCYYHNYLLGEMFASQMWAKLAAIPADQVGGFFRSRIFEPGTRYSWNEMIKRATGEPLNPKYFTDEVVKE